MSDEVSVVAAGQALIRRALPPDSVAAMAPLFAGADMAFCNLEVPLAGGTHSSGPELWPMKDKAVQAVHPRVLDSLRAMGINALSLANNHAGDLGPGGVLATLAEVEGAGFLAAGAGADAAAAGRVRINARGIGLLAVDAGPWPPHVYAAPGRPGVARLRVARRLVLPQADAARLRAIAEAIGHTRRRAARIQAGFEPATEADDLLGVPFVGGERLAEEFVPDPGDMARHEATLAAARPGTRLLVASVHTHHWPPDWADPAAETPAWLRDVARAFIDAGADLVLGHGPPVVMPPETWRDGLILPGLGNLVFHSDRQGVRAMPQAWRGVVARVMFVTRRIAGLSLQAITLDATTPKPWRDQDAGTFLRALHQRAGLPGGHVSTPAPGALGWQAA